MDSGLGIAGKRGSTLLLMAFISCAKRLLSLLAFLMGRMGLTQRAGAGNNESFRRYTECNGLKTFNVFLCIRRFCSWFWGQFWKGPARTRDTFKCLTSFMCPASELFLA